MLYFIIPGVNLHQFNYTNFQNKYHLTDVFARLLLLDVFSGSHHAGVRGANIMRLSSLSPRHYVILCLHRRNIHTFDDKIFEMCTDLRVGC